MGAGDSGAAAPEGLVVFSPLPPTRSGIADYTAELLPALGCRVPVTAVVASERDLRPVEGADVIAEVEYRRRSALHGQPHLYQLCNNLHGAHVYRAALRRPGVVLLHDPVLHDLVEALTLGRGDWVGYEAVLAENYGPAGRRLARLRRLGFFSPAQRRLLPLHRHVLDRSRGVLVHSRFASSRLEVAADVPVRVVPHHVPPAATAAWDGPDRAAARARLGLPAGDEPLLLSLGFVTRAKGLDVALRALARLKNEGVACRLIVAGAEDGSVELARLVGEAEVGDRVHALGWVPEADFFALLRAADLLLLRPPSSGESSGVLARALGAGLPALAYDAGPSAEYPDRFVEKVPFGTEETGGVARAIKRLLADPVDLRARGAEARAALRRDHTPDASARRILAAVREWTQRRMLHTSDIFSPAWNL